jgi:hypothetical protein
MEKTMSKAPKNKPIDEITAEEMYQASKEFQNAVEDFMSDKGYRWSHSENMWVDDGSLALEWADRKNDERRDRELSK